MHKFSMSVGFRLASVGGFIAVAAFASGLTTTTAGGHVSALGSASAGLAIGSGASTAPPSPVSTESVTPAVHDLTDGGTQTIYQLPEGGTVESDNPPASFQPLTATDAQLAQYDFPARPASGSDLEDWTRVMSSYRSDTAPGPAAVELPVSKSPAPGAYGLPYGTNWAGYTDGSWNATSSKYVAVKGEFKVPSMSGTACSINNDNNLFAWVGLGGTTGNNDLSQQGIECGDTYIASGAAFRPWDEFADTEIAKPFCVSYASWTLAAGNVIYMNMSFQTSTHKAFYYVEDETTGVTHSCSETPPSGWGFSGNTADWIMEAPGNAADYHSIAFTDANAELGSSSSWVTAASQSTTKLIEGSSSSSYCSAPGALSSTSFTITWHATTCY